MHSNSFQLYPWTCSTFALSWVSKEVLTYPHFLHHYHRITLVDDKGADTRKSVLVPCHQVRVGGEEAGGGRLPAWSRELVRKFPSRSW